MNPYRNGRSIGIRSLYRHRLSLGELLHRRDVLAARGCVVKHPATTEPDADMGNAQAFGAEKEVAEMERAHGPGLFAPVVGPLVGRCQRDALLGRLGIDGAFGATDLNTDHARRGVLSREALELGFIRGGPRFTAVAIAEGHIVCELRLVALSRPARDW